MNSWPCLLSGLKTGGQEKPRDTVFPSQGTPKDSHMHGSPLVWLVPFISPRGPKIGILPPPGAEKKMGFFWLYVPVLEKKSRDYARKGGKCLNPQHLEDRGRMITTRLRPACSTQVPGQNNSGGVQLQEASGERATGHEVCFIVVELWSQISST